MSTLDNTAELEMQNWPTFWATAYSAIVKFRVLTLFPSRSRDGSSYCLALSPAVIKKLIGMFHIARVGIVSCSISCRVIWRKMLEGYKEARA